MVQPLEVARLTHFSDIKNAGGATPAQPQLHVSVFLLPFFASIEWLLTFYVGLKQALIHLAAACFRIPSLKFWLYPTTFNHLVGQEAGLLLPGQWAAPSCSF